MKALNFVSYSAGSPTPFVPGFNCVRAEISKIAYHRQLNVRFFPNNVRFAPKADMCSIAHVRFVPKADMAATYFDEALDENL